MRPHHPKLSTTFLLERNRAKNILTSTVALLLTLLGAIGASAQIKDQPATHRTDIGPRSIKSILNPDGTIRRDTPGSFDTKGFNLWTGADGAPRLTNPSETGSAVADSCSDLWDERFAANGLNGWVYAIAVASDGTVYVGGTFSQAGGVTANHIAKWNGLRWSSLGSGTNDEIYAITIDEQGSGVDGYDVYVGGAFTVAGGVNANRIAKWNGSAWSALGSGMNGFVAALDVSHSNEELYLYAGGDFTSAGSVFPANRVARWDGSGWSALGVGVGSSLDEAVYALKIRFAESSQVLVGGEFSSAGGVSRNNFAYWTGTAWNNTSFPEGVNGVVEDIAVSSGTVHLAGNFPGYPSDAVYWFNLLEPYAWEPVPRDYNGNDPIWYDNTVYAFDLLNGNYRAGGIFTGRVDVGTGEPISGLGTHVSALALGNGATYVGGGFSTIGCRISENFGRFFERRYGGSEFSSDWHDQTLWIPDGVPGSLSTANIGSHDAYIVSSNANILDLRVDNGHLVDVGASRTLTVFRNLNISDGYVTGAGTVVIDKADVNAIYGGGPNGFISATLSRKINGSGTFNFPVGSNGLYGGVLISSIIGSATTSVKTNSGGYAGLATGLPANRLQRWWNIASTPDGDLTFHYNDNEIVGNEAAYGAYRISGGVATAIPSVVNTSTNTVTVPNGAHLLSGDWTLADASGPPNVSTQAPTIIRLTQAELSSTVDPNGFNTTLWWRFSTVDPGTCNDTFGEETPHFGVGAGFSPFTYSQTDGRFSPGTTYYFCAIASNSAGTVFGSILSFTTLSESAPEVYTNPAAAVTTTTATLDANGLPNGSASTGWFRYSTQHPGSCSDSFGTRTPASGGTALGSGTGVANFTQSLSGLLPSTTYYYCGIVSNSLGTAFGQIVSFTTRSFRTIDNTGDEFGLGQCTPAPDDCKR